MTTVATLQQPVLEAVPGGTAATELLIRNSGDLVEAYRVEPIGEPAAWAVVEPAVVRLYPGADALVRLSFTPPRSPHVVPAELPYGVRVIPTERPGEITVPEGMLRVLPLRDTFAEITPRHSKTTRRAAHEVAVDNRGNVPVQARLTTGATDPDLTVRIRPAALAVPPGHAGFVTVDVRHRRRRWRKGQSESRPFQVAVATDEEGPLLLDAGSVQRPVLAGAAGKVLAALLALLVIGAAVWFGLLKRAVESAARDAVATAPENLANVEPDGGAGAPGGGSAADPPGASPLASPSASPSGTPSATPTRRPTPRPTPRATTPPVANFNRSLELTTVLNGTGTARYQVPSGKVLQITDMFVQNPQGDRGRADVLVNGARVITESLGNLRTNDYHVQSPLEVTAGRRVELRVTCQQYGTRLAGMGSDRCRTFLTIVGELR